MFDTESNILQVDVSNKVNNDQKFYFRLAATAFKERYNNHKRDVKYMKYQYNTEVTKYIWNLKNNNIKYNIQWKVFDKSYGNSNSKCKFCLTKKLRIINHVNDNNMLNKKPELINKSRHLKSSY